VAVGAGVGGRVAVGAALDPGVGVGAAVGTGVGVLGDGTHAASPRPTPASPAPSRNSRRATRPSGRIVRQRRAARANALARPSDDSIVARDGKGGPTGIRSSVDRRDLTIRGVTASRCADGRPGQIDSEPVRGS
jgi:hypothetical protein